MRRLLFATLLTVPLAAQAWGPDGHQTVATIAAGLVAFFGLNRTAQAQHFTAKVERGEIADVVEATGTINAVITESIWKIAPRFARSSAGAIASSAWSQPRSSAKW